MGGITGSQTHPHSQNCTPGVRTNASGIREILAQ